MINSFINFEFFILCFSSLFALINPIGLVPIFITITENHTQNEKNKIAGGILLFKISLDMIESKRSRTRTTPAEMEDVEGKDEIAYTPLGIPLIAGPGSIASIMILSSEAKDYSDKSTLFIALFIVLLITFIIFKLSKILSDYFGKSGLRIMQRIMGLILMVISIEFVLKGIEETIKNWNLF